jgi:TetR/AcrR family transcriptional regulator, ethionamide resistance regulator
MSRPAARRARSGGGEVQRDVRRSLLDATRRLLADHRFDQLTVADILAAAQVSRASFYFYFESKHAVLAELVRAAVEQAQAAAQPWLEHRRDQSPREMLRQGTLDGARLWREHGPVLRAIVENWRSDPQLTQLWSEMMERFTAAATERIERDRGAGRATATTVDARVLAAALVWLGERAYYLAALGHPPFDDEQALVDVLTEIWVATIYGQPPPS